MKNNGADIKAIHIISTAVRIATSSPCVFMQVKPTNKVNDTKYIVNTRNEGESSTQEKIASRINGVFMSTTVTFRVFSPSIRYPTIMKISLESMLMSRRK